MCYSYSIHYSSIHPSIISASTDPEYFCISCLCEIGCEEIDPLPKPLCSADAFFSWCRLLLADLSLIGSTHYDLGRPFALSRATWEAARLLRRGQAGGRVTVINSSRSKDFFFVLPVSWTDSDCFASFVFSPSTDQHNWVVLCFLLNKWRYLTLTSSGIRRSFMKHLWKLGIDWANLQAFIPCQYNLPRGRYAEFSVLLFSRLIKFLNEFKRKKKPILTCKTWFLFYYRKLNIKEQTKYNSVFCGAVDLQCSQSVSLQEVSPKKAVVVL